MNLRTDSRQAARYACAEERQVVAHFFGRMSDAPRTPYDRPFRGDRCRGFETSAGGCVTPTAASGFLAYDAQTVITTAHSATEAWRVLFDEDLRPPEREVDDDDDGGPSDPGDDDGPVRVDPTGEDPWPLDGPSPFGKVCSRGNLDYTVVRDSWGVDLRGRQCSEVISMTIRNFAGVRGSEDNPFTPEFDPTPDIWRPSRDWAVLTLEDEIRDFEDVFTFTNRSGSEVMNRTIFNFGHPGSRRLQEYALYNDTVQCYHAASPGVPLPESAQADVGVPLPAGGPDDVAGIRWGGLPPTRPPVAGDPAFLTVDRAGFIASQRPPCGIQLVKGNGTAFRHDWAQGFFRTNLPNAGGQSGGPVLAFNLESGAPADGCGVSRARRVSRTEVLGMMTHNSGGPDSGPVVLRGAPACLNVGTVHKQRYSVMNDADSYKKDVRRVIDDPCSSGVRTIDRTGREC